MAGVLRQALTSLARCGAVALLLGGTSAFAAGPRPATIWIPEAPDGLAARQMTYLVKRIEERLPRHFTFDVRTDGECPPQAELLDQVREGRIDIAVVDDAMIDAVPRLALFRIPWLFDDRLEVQRALYAGLEDEIRSHVEDLLKVVVVGLYARGFHHVRGSRAFNGPEDFARRKILVDSGKSLRDLWRELGAVPQKISMDTAAQALGQGTVEAFDGMIDELAALPLGGNANVITLSRHVYAPAFVVASRSFWESLTDAERAAITECGLDFSDTAARLAETYAQAVLKRLPAHIRVHPVPRDHFAQITAEHRAAYQRAFGTDWLEILDFSRQPQR